MILLSVVIVDSVTSLPIAQLYASSHDWRDTDRERVGRVPRVQVLLAEIDVLQRVLVAGAAARFADRVGGNRTGRKQRRTNDRERANAPPEIRDLHGSLIPLNMF